ncbi:MAG: hypothetical protein KA142_11910, partial [Chromatiaceae bacterium]|nr:hypothetical protein [Chromatiaceae bacterium]
MAPPVAAPSFGDAHLGGYYAGAIWDEVCTATGSTDINTGSKTLTIAAGSWPFYYGQQLRVAPGPTN